MGKEYVHLLRWLRWGIPRWLTMGFTLMAPVYDKSAEPTKLKGMGGIMIITMIQLRGSIPSIH